LGVVREGGDHLEDVAWIVPAVDHLVAAVLILEVQSQVDQEVLRSAVEALEGQAQVALPCLHLVCFVDDLVEGKTVAQLPWYHEYD